MSSLFTGGSFRLHSGQSSDFLIDCNALTDADLFALARKAHKLVPEFGVVEGVPAGGLRFAEALLPYAMCTCGHCWDAHDGHTYEIGAEPPTHCSQACGCKAFVPIDSLLIADDVCTTGGSLEGHRAGREARGLVIFARGPCPGWVVPLFTAADVFKG